jgi:hyperosmotically inducible protein
MLRNSLIATALVCAFAAVPFTQAIAQDAQMQKSEDNQTVPDKAADAWITTKVKSELATAKHVKASDISVDTSDSVVTLSGTVATKNEKARAVKLAKSVKGVKKVEASGLTVSAAATTTSHTSSDMPASNASAGH